MKRRIYINFICLLMPSVLVLSVTLSFLFHNAAKEQERTLIQGHARLLSDMLNSGIIGGLQFSDYVSYSENVPRMTVISPDGTVLLDSRASADYMENHMDRPELIEAFDTGTGESLRRSDTFGVDMYYYAILLQDGNVLRISGLIDGITRVFAVVLPAIITVTLLILFIANFVGRRLTERIIAPLETIDFDSEAMPVYDELTPYALKIQQQKRDLDAQITTLSERADTIETINKHMNEGLVLTDADGIILTANASARELFGNDVESNNILHIYRNEEFQQGVKKCLAGESVEMQLDRSERVYSIHMSPVITSGTTRGAVILFHDATARHRAERQRREFSANVSHELKTPLTTISALSEMISNGIAKEDDIISFASRITEQAGRLLVLIEDIIRLSEFDEGKSAMENTVFDLWELAETVIGALRDSAGNIEIKLIGERFNISANHRMIDELLHNLIDNAIKYNSEDGCVTVELELVNRLMCKISVSDNGIGIPLEHQPHVFERFYRVDRSRSKKTGGTGLGLSIVKHITEFHNGWVELNSSENIGTTVSCYLKL
ncbi:MAG: ATP-binding protein [Oscillospiraceae bacterium]|nr:ATP-binding protein [Oscillospiraceae bacterium]